MIGDITFLEAFDRTGRVLNIAVTRSDGRAPPLLCNYLTTPHLLVYSASLASCSIPGIYQAVELMAKGQNGEIEPYFPRDHGWRWTDGGLQVWKRAPLPLFARPHASLLYLVPYSSLTLTLSRPYLHELYPSPKPSPNPNPPLPSRLQADLPKQRLSELFNVDRDRDRLSISATLTHGSGRALFTGEPIHRQPGQPAGPSPIN